MGYNYFMYLQCDALHSFLISSKNIPSINFLFHIFQTIIIAVGYDSMALGFENIKIIHHLASEESCPIFQCRFINNHLSTLCLDALHDTLNGTLTEVIRVGLHGEAIHAYYTGMLTASIVAAVFIISLLNQDLSSQRMCPIH